MTKRSRSEEMWEVIFLRALVWSNLFCEDNLPNDQEGMWNKYKQPTLVFWGKTENLNQRVNAFYKKKKNHGPLGQSLGWKTQTSKYSGLQKYSYPLSFSTLLLGIHGNFKPEQFSQFTRFVWKKSLNMSAKFPNTFLVLHVSNLGNKKKDTV